MHGLRWGNALAAFGLMLWIAFAATAQTNAPTESALPPLPETTTPVTGPWYGWQLLVGDAAAMGAGLVISQLADARGDTRFGDGVASAWGLGFLSSTLIHGAHGQRGRAGSAIAVRVLLAPTASLLGLIGGCISTADDGGDGCSVGARYGFAAGMILGVLADAAVLGHESDAKPTTEWYGWQPAIIDGAMLTAGIVAAAQADDLNRSETGVALAVFPWVFGFTLAPWIHGAHGRWGTAIASFGMRSVGVGLVSVVGLTGYCAASGGDDGCAATGATYGLFGGALLAAVVDAALLSYAKPDTTPATAQVMPYIAPERRGLTLGLSGSL